jgi:hypothetical protein
MSEPEDDIKPASVNPGYAAFQLANAFTTNKEHHDPATSDRTRERIAKWERVLQNRKTAVAD